MASTGTARVCRLCTTETTTKRSINLFSSSGIQHKWSSRISSLLEVSIDCNDRLSQYFCDNCKNRIVSLEKSLADLTAFRVLAKSSLSKQEKIRGPVKRYKVTSGSVGVSPDTSRERPPSKLSRKRLDFQCKLNYKLKIVKE